MSMLEIAMALNHDVKEAEDGKLVGDPTEIALVEFTEDQFGNKKELDKIIEKYPSFLPLMCFWRKRYLKMELI